MNSGRMDFRIPEERMNFEILEGWINSGIVDG